jgi:hypothetical protein
MTGGKPTAVLLQPISGVSAINPLVAAFYDIHGGKREVLFFYIVPDNTQDTVLNAINFLLIPLVITIMNRYFSQTRANSFYCTLPYD